LRLGKSRHKEQVMRQAIHTAGDFVSDLGIRALIWLALLLPYRWRVPAAGWVARHAVAPLAGFGPRIRANLDHVLPGMSEAERRALIREVSDNVGRTFVEFYSHAPFSARMRDVEVQGPGKAALDQARAEGRPAILVSGHFGNYEAMRVAFGARGDPVGALYRPMNNRFFNRHYAAAMTRIGTPLCARDRQGMGQLIRHMRAGGVTGILIDQFFANGAAVTFFGQTAPTATAIAELALKYDAALIPSYCIRQPNGLDFELVMEAPVPHTDPITMTQACNDSLEARVRAHMGQWLWIHRRWKPERQRRRAAASTRPGPSS
jgi:KDO2-lipid IV(A) lauroyltransferase